LVHLANGFITPRLSVTDRIIMIKKMTLFIDPGLWVRIIS